MSSKDKPQEKRQEYQMSEEEEQTLDHISYCLATRHIAEQGTFVELDGKYYVIEIAGRLRIARFPLDGRTKGDIYRALREGIAKHLEERDAQTERD